MVTVRYIKTTKYGNAYRKKVARGKAVARANDRKRRRSKAKTEREKQLIDLEEQQEKISVRKIDTNSQESMINQARQRKTKYYAEDNIQRQSRELTQEEKQVLINNNQQGFSSTEEQKPKDFYGAVKYYKQEPYKEKELIGVAKWNEVKQAQKPKRTQQKQQSSSKFTSEDNQPNYTISEKKPSFIKKQIYNMQMKSSQGKSTFEYIPLMAISGAYGFSKGFIKGVTAPLRLKFYTEEIPSMAGFVGGIFTGKTTEKLSRLNIKSSVMYNPVGTSSFVGEFLGYGTGFKTFTNLYSNSGLPRVTTEKIGDSRVVGVDYGFRGKGKSILSFKGTKNPDFIQPKTGAGTDFYLKNINKFIKEDTTMLIKGKKISPQLQKEFIETSIKATRELSLQKSKYYDVKDLINKGTSKLTGEEAGIVFKSNKGKGKVFGSYSSRYQLNPQYKRTIGDIEKVFTTSNEAVLMKEVKTTLNELSQGSSSKFRVPKDSPFHIEKWINGKWEKVIEYKGKGIGEGDIAPEKAFGFNLWKNRDFKKVEGTPTAMLRGELKRKLAGSIMQNKGKIGVAHEGRFKDVTDLYRHIQTLGESRGLYKSPATKDALRIKDKLGITYTKDAEMIEIAGIKNYKYPSISPRFSSYFSGFLSIFFYNSFVDSAHQIKEMPH